MTRRLSPPATHELVDDCLSIARRYGLSATDHKVDGAARSWSRTARRLSRQALTSCDPEAAVAIVLALGPNWVLDWCRRTGANIGASADFVADVAHNYAGLEIQARCLTDLRYAAAAPFLRSLGTLGRSDRRQFLAEAINCAAVHNKTDRTTIDVWRSLAKQPVIDDIYFDATGTAGPLWVETLCGADRFAMIARQANMEAAMRNPALAWLNPDLQGLDRSLINRLI